MHRPEGNYKSNHLILEYKAMIYFRATVAVNFYHILLRSKFRLIDCWFTTLTFESSVFSAKKICLGLCVGSVCSGGSICTYILLVGKKLFLQQVIFSLFFLGSFRTFLVIEVEPKRPPIYNLLLSVWLTNFYAHYKSDHKYRSTFCTTLNTKKWLCAIIWTFNPFWTTSIPYPVMYIYLKSICYTYYLWFSCWNKFSIPSPVILCQC